MSIGKKEIIEVLSDRNIRSIRFRAGAVNINCDEYGRVSDFVESGAIKVKTTKGISQYDPPSNTLYLKDGDPQSLEVRTRIVHECTHVVSDINKAAISRLRDEAAAYIAQFTFLKLLDPSFRVTMITGGGPEIAVMRVGLGIVEKYKLGQHAGYGATISGEDLDDLGRLVQKHPEYARLKETDQLASDGVILTDAQIKAHEINRRVRDKIKYQDWLVDVVTRAGIGPNKESAYGQLYNHFFMVYQVEAANLQDRLSHPKAGDTFAERFNAGLSAQQKHELLMALRVPKPPG